MEVYWFLFLHTMSSWWTLGRHEMDRFNQIFKKKCRPGRSSKRILENFHFVLFKLKVSTKGTYIKEDKMSTVFLYHFDLRVVTLTYLSNQPTYSQSRRPLWIFSYSLLHGCTTFLGATLSKFEWLPPLSSYILLKKNHSFPKTDRRLTISIW